MASESVEDRCTCLYDINELLAKQGSNTVIGDSLLWNRTTGASRVVVELAVYKRDPKSRQKTTAMVPTFCPFCGQRYQPEAADVACD